jgi:hypothetical protein
MKANMIMLKIFRIWPVAVVAALTLVSCTDRLVEAPPLGGAVAQNTAAQIVDPEPESTEVAPPLNGARNNGAQKRYEEGKVLKPKDVRTSASGSGSSGGNGN